MTAGPATPSGRPTFRVGRTVWPIAAVIVAVACAVAPTPSPNPSASQVRSPTVAASASRPASTDPVAAPVSPLPEPAAIDGSVAAFTIVCDDWAGDAPPELVECDDAARLALGTIGDARAATIRRLDVGFIDPCLPGSACLPARAHVRWVIARTAAYATIVVRIERQTSGELAAWPGQDGPPLPPPAFAAPPVRAPDVGRDAPTELRTRPPLAFCGAERLANPDDYDAAARRCFVDGVLAWVPVELISIEASTGAVPVTTVLRFTGRGAIRRYVRSEQPWAAVDCALGRIATPAAFVITSPCDRHELRP